MAEAGGPIRLPLPGMTPDRSISLQSMPIIVAPGLSGKQATFFRDGVGRFNMQPGP